MGIKKVKNCPACEKTPRKNKRFAQAHGYFSWEIRCCHLLFTYYNFLAFFGGTLAIHLGSKKSQKLPISLKSYPKCSIFAFEDIFLREVPWCHFRPHYGSPRSQWGLKMPPCISMYVKKPNARALLYPISLVF